MPNCRITAIAPDGQRSTIEVEAKSLYRAVFIYNAQAVTVKALNLLVPERDTVFEVEVGGKVYSTTFGRAMDWANRVQR
jgi:hypothetical protein